MEYKYYAFISYKREDENWAVWLQNEFEHYHLPSTLNRSDDFPKEFRPIFRDVDELSAGNLPNQIYDALSNSRFLVVICSPLAAQSKWVNKEINDFIEIGKRRGLDNIDNIFPFIVDGIPHSNDPNTECFPEILRNLSDAYERIGGNVQENGREKAFIKTLAGTLNIAFSELWDRFEIEKIEEEQRRINERNKLLISQSRYLAEKAEKWIDGNNSSRASLLLLHALPANIYDKIDRPLTTEAERAFRKALIYKSSVFEGEICEDSIFISPKNRTLLSFFKQSLLMTNIDTGEVQVFNIPLADEVKYTTFSKSGKRFLYLTDYEIGICDCDKMQVIHKHEFNHIAYIVNKAYFHDNEEIVLLETILSDYYIYDGSLNEVYEYSALNKDYRFEQIERNKVEYDSDNKYVVKIDGNRLKVYDNIKHELVICFDDLLSESSVANFNSTRGYVIYLDYNNVLKCVNVSTGTRYIYDCNFNHSIDKIHFLDETNEILILDYQGKFTIIPFDSFSYNINSSRIIKRRFSPNTCSIAAVISDSLSLYSIGIWNINSLKTIPNGELFSAELKPDKIIGTSTFLIRDFKFTSDSTNIAIWYGDNSIAIYNIPENRSVAVCRCCSDCINDIVFSPCGRFIAIALDNNEIQIRDVASLNVISSIQTSAPIIGIEYSNSGEYILATCKNSVKLYSTKSLKQIKTFKTFKNRKSLLNAQFSLCQSFVIAFTGHNISVYDLNTALCINSIKYNYDFIYNFVLLNKYGDFVMTTGEGDLFLGNIFMQDLDKKYGGVPFYLNISNDQNYILLGARLYKKSKYLLSVRDDSEVSWGHYIGDKNFFLNLRTDDNKDELFSFEPVGYISSSKFAIPGVITQIKISPRNSILLETNEGQSFTYAIKNNRIETVEYDEAEVFTNIDTIHDKYKMEFREHVVNIVDMETQKSVYICDCYSNNWKVLCATFSFTADYIVYLCADSLEQEYRLCFRRFEDLQSLIDKTRARFSDSLLSEEEREQCYL